MLKCKLEECIGLSVKWDSNRQRVCHFADAVLQAGRVDGAEAVMWENSALGLILHRPQQGAFSALLEED